MISEHSDRMIRARIDFALHVFENLRAVYPPWRAFSAVNPASNVTIQRFTSAAAPRFAAMISDMLKVRDERIHRILARARHGQRLCPLQKVGGPGSRYTRLGEWKWNAPKDADVSREANRQSGSDSWRSLCATAHLAQNPAAVRQSTFREHYGCTSGSVSRDNRLDRPHSRATRWSVDSKL